MSGLHSVNSDERLEELGKVLRDLNLLTQLQALDAAISAIIKTHPDPDDLREELQLAFSRLISTTNAQLIAAGQPTDLFVRLLRDHADGYLALLSD